MKRPIEPFNTLMCFVDLEVMRWQDIRRRVGALATALVARDPTDCWGEDSPEDQVIHSDTWQQEQSA